jgi:hypothetical protein
MAPPTAKYELLQLRLGRDLAAYVTEARSDGRAWWVIAADLRSSTGMTVTGESLRTWFGARESGVAS